MIFTNKSRALLKEWQADFQRAEEMFGTHLHTEDMAKLRQLAQEDNPLLPEALKWAIAGKDCSTALVGSIAAQAVGNQQIEDSLPELRKEAKLVLKDIGNHYTVRAMDGAVMLTKKM
jgi:hypothetical protein